MATESKVCDLDIASDIEHQIVRFDISVSKIAVVHVLQTLCNLFAIECTFAVAKVASTNQELHKVSTRCKLHGNVNIMCIHEDEVGIDEEFAHVFRSIRQSVKEANLSSQNLSILDTKAVHIDTLASTDQSAFIFGNEHFAMSSHAYQFDLMKLPELWVEVVLLVIALGVLFGHDALDQCRDHVNCLYRLWMDGRSGCYSICDKGRVEQVCSYTYSIAVTRN